MIRAFPGGIRLDGRKERVAGLAVVEIAAPPTVVIHLSQHVGQPARPVVRPGDAVETGTRIGEASGSVSAAVHSSVSGRVKSVGQFPHPWGATSVAIEIENDGRDKWVDLSGWRDLTGADPRVVVDAVRDAGIVGLGGAAFPTHVKLSSTAGGRVEVLIANGAECEPYLACDHRAMVERAADIVEGLKVMMRVVGAERGLVAVGWNKPDAAQSLRRALKGESRIKVAEVETKYPQGAEKQMIKTLTGREVPRAGLPVEVGCLVHNVSTVLAVYECLKFGRPLVARVMTVAGSAARSPGNFRVRIGTRLGHVIDQAGGAAADCGMILAGGPMSGVAQPSMEVPVVKATSGLILLRAREARLPEPGPCTRCGRCVGTCPMRLMPNEIARAVERKRLSQAKEYGLVDCIECGVCAYVCPSKIRHVFLVKQGKSALVPGTEGH